MKNVFPNARIENIVVQEIKDEFLVCDLKENQVFCLNQTAGEVWKLCDGKTEVKKIAEKMTEKLHAPVSEEMVLFTLEELYRKKLISQEFTIEKMHPGVSRREVVRRLGLSSMVALPFISSVVMPKAVQAQSNGCVDNGDCPNPLYCDLNTNTCQPLPTNCSNVDPARFCPPNLACCNEGFTCSFGC